MRPCYRLPSLPTPPSPTPPPSHQALGYLSDWLRAARPAAAARLPPAGGPLDVDATTAAFDSAASAAPRDADLASALGVLRSLGRDYGGAADAFRAALEARPDDYSLWNKLGATLANAGRPADAAAAYRRALDAKPNYTRAWTNMGIAQACACSWRGVGEDGPSEVSRDLARIPPIATTRLHFLAGQHGGVRCGRPLLRPRPVPQPPSGGGVGVRAHCLGVRGARRPDDPGRCRGCGGAGGGAAAMRGLGRVGCPSVWCASTGSQAAGCGLIGLVWRLPRPCAHHAASRCERPALTLPPAARLGCYNVDSR